MSRIALFAVIVFVFVGCADGSDEVVEQGYAEEVETPTQPTAEEPESEDVYAFFARFKATARANNPEALANMGEFPFADSGVTRQEFLDQYYEMALGDGAFRDRLLAGSPASLHEEEDGRYAFYALINDCANEDEYDCESAVVYYFGQNAEGHWRLVDMMFAG